MRPFLWLIVGMALFVIAAEVVLTMGGGG